jgi:hypothetical protein
MRRQPGSVCMVNMLSWMHAPGLHAAHCWQPVQCSRALYKGLGQLLTSSLPPSQTLMTMNLQTPAGEVLRVGLQAVDPEGQIPALPGMPEMCAEREGAHSSVTRGLSSVRSMPTDCCPCRWRPLMMSPASARSAV